MKELTVTIVRIYINESSDLQNKLLAYLHDDAKVRGVSVFRAISGYGDRGQIHNATLVDLSLELPLVIEFFDEKTKVESIIEHLSNTVKPEHLVYWDAKSRA